MGLGVFICGALCVDAPQKHGAGSGIDQEGTDRQVTGFRCALCGIVGN